MQHGEKDFGTNIKRPNQDVSIDGFYNFAKEKIKGPKLEEMERVSVQLDTLTHEIIQLVGIENFEKILKNEEISPMSITDIQAASIEIMKEMVLDEEFEIKLGVKKIDTITIFFSKDPSLRQKFNNLAKVLSIIQNFLIIIPTSENNIIFNQKQAIYRKKVKEIYKMIGIST